jgi:hypothetical protein
MGLVSMITAWAVFNQPWDACSFGILLTLDRMASIKFYQDTLGNFVDKLNKFHFDDPWLGFGGSKLWPIRQGQYHVPTLLFLISPLFDIHRGLC